MTSPDSRPGPLTLDRLTVRYGSKIAADEVSLSVSEGEVYALLGRNGAGKSSLIRCLLGLQRPALGEARLFGRDAWHHRRSLLAQVGVVPEDPDAPPTMTPRELARFCAHFYPTWNAAAVDERLGRFDIPPDLAFRSLSKGQRAQVSLTLALAPEPRLLILDDPTLGLDAIARRSVFEELVVELADRGTTVLLSTHDLAGVEGIASRIGILRRGRLLLDESLEALKRRFRTLCFPPASDPPNLGELEPLRLRSGPWGVEVVVANHHPTDESSPGAQKADPMSLEEIFVAVDEHGSESGCVEEEGA